jgi:predicted metal-dependent hydrolase
MPNKIVVLPRIGEVMLVKRRGAKNLRLSILPNGKVRVSLPYWAPYTAAIAFANSRAEWIARNSASSKPAMLRHGQRIGKSYRLNFVENSRSAGPSARLGINSITVTSSVLHTPEDVQTAAQAAAERALRKEAKQLLGGRLASISMTCGLHFKELKIKRLTSRWGSCSSHNVITLNYFLVQLPWNLIDYVIVHELAHTRYMNHSREFWALVESIIPDAKQLRKEIKTYRPILTPADSMP